MFLCSVDLVVMILVVYVDDIIFIGNNDDAISICKAYLQRTFDVKDLRPLCYFLGVKVARSPTRLSLSQRKYALDLLPDAWYSGCKPADTPMDINTKLSTSDETRLDNLAFYQ